jgi:DnaJ-class molecular chaperone
MAERAAFLRDVVGNPWRPVHIESYKRTCVNCAGTGKGGRNVAVGPTCTRCNGMGHENVRQPWLTPQVRTLAEAAYEERGRKCERCVRHGWIDGKCPDCRGTGRIDDGTLDGVRLAILADAMEEAGCTSEPLLMHLRGICGVCEGDGYHRHPPVGFVECTPCKGTGKLPGPHVRGCWALDLVLGKS